MSKTNSDKRRICSRGHEFTGSGPCPICWPAGAERKNRASQEKASRDAGKTVRRTLPPRS